MNLVNMYIQIIAITFARLLLRDHGPLIRVDDTRTTNEGISSCIMI